MMKWPLCSLQDELSLRVEDLAFALPSQDTYIHNCATCYYTKHTAYNRKSMV
jgi:hypothetical protein